MKNIIIYILMIFLSHNSFAFQKLFQTDEKAKKFGKTITEKDLKKHLFIYASDEFEGRDTGARGQKMAVNYLVNFYKEIGIKAGNTNGSYVQEMTLDIRRDNVGQVETENVLAIIEGNEKPNEFVILTAHLDHVGKKGDVIYNGADDDGSGTVALLEIAEAFKKAVEKGRGPKRSILFLHVTGEEKGLLGSKYYSENPIYPLENTVVNLNVDMIGRIDPTREKKNREYVYIIGSDHDSQDLHNLSEQTNAETINIELDYRFNDTDDPNRFYYRSDHYNFAKNGIPIIFYFTGTHEDYHQPTDTPDKIEYDLLELRTQLIFYTAWNIANRDKRIIVDPKPEKKVYNIKKDDMDSYLGTYSAKNFPLKFIFKNNNGNLNIDIAGQGSFDLEAVERHQFKLQEASVELEFSPSENKLKFKQGPYEVFLKKE
jgi:hypothetical protein